MIKGGYILQPRLFDRSDASKMPPVTRELWFYLLRNVNHRPKDKFKRGEGFFSLTDIQNDLSWYAGYRKMTYSKPQLTKSLRRLREGNMIATTKATRGVFVTICNYDTYQDPKKYKGNGEKVTAVPRKKRPGITKNKNDKNERRTTKNKREYGTFKNVLLSEDEFKRLQEKFNGTLDDKIDNLSEGIESKGYEYKSHYATILNWARRDAKRNPQGSTNDNHNGFDERNYRQDATKDEDIPEFLRQ